MHSLLHSLLPPPTPTLSPPHFHHQPFLLPLSHYHHYQTSFSSSSRRPTTHISTKPTSQISNGSHESITSQPEPMETQFLRKPTITEQPKSPPKDDDIALAPFLKFFRHKESDAAINASEEEEEVVVEEEVGGEEVNSRGLEKLGFEYYDPKAGDFVVGVVVSGNENKLDVNVGADMLGTMLKKEVLPLYEDELENSLCDMSKDLEEFMVAGKIGVVKDEEVLGGISGRCLVEPGTVLFAEVMGRTLSGRPLLSTRRLTKKIAWHRVRQIKLLDEPIEVKITEWNTGGILSRIEGLRAFLPKADLMSRVTSFADLKENVGRRIFVKIRWIDEEKNELIISEKDAWDAVYLREGVLLEGTVRKLFPFGAQIGIGETNRSGLLHITNISKGRVSSVSDVLKEGEKLKALVVRSSLPDKISLSTAELESSPGLFLSNKEKVFEEAGDMARKYREKQIPSSPGVRVLETSQFEALPFDDECTMYANWDWFKFERADDSQTMTLEE